MRRPTATAIRTEDLSKAFGQTRALISLNLEVPEGEVFGYLGPNGAGKTTTIRLLLGLIRATSGRAEIFGVDCQADPVEAHRRVAYVPGEVSLWPSLTGTETLHLLGRVQGHVDIAYRDLLLERFEFDPSKKVRAYSKGNRQKLILIAGLMTRADLLLLDEPTAGLDPLMERTFRECVTDARDRGQTVFLSSHILSEVEALCDRVAILRRPARGGGHARRDAPPLGASRRSRGGRFGSRRVDHTGGERGGDRRQPSPLPGDGLDRALARRPRRSRRAPSREQGALARGALPRSLRVG